MVAEVNLVQVDKNNFLLLVKGLILYNGFFKAKLNII